MQYTVAVRTLCEFTAKEGDLDLRFTPSPTAQEGIAGHQIVQARRGPDYETEITLRGEHGVLVVRGRADGYDPAANRLEEIKTFRGDLARQPHNHRQLHWAQARIYGWLLCQARGLDEIALSLVYFDVGTQDEAVFTETHTAAALRGFFEAQCERFIAWAAQELAHRAARDAGLAAMAFPHPDFRTGQRELAEAVYKSAASGRCLMAQAPTGIGKTVGTLFPLLKAVPAQRLDKVFFLAAKTPGRRLALDALRLLRGDGGAPLRVLELASRDKSCEHPDKACHGESCPLAAGFYDRLPAARADALATGPMDRPALRTVALGHGVCPYYLGQELARWSDVVVGDYNYYFDTHAMLHALTQAREWRVAVLADEAHNLVERARAMYTAQLSRAAFDATRRAAPKALARQFDRLADAWRPLCDPAAPAYAALDDVPEAFALALQRCCSAIGDHFAEAAPQPPGGRLQQFYFDALGFLRLADSFGAHSVADLTHAPLPDTGQPDTTLCIRNLVPGPFLAPRFAAAHSAALFSATLSPPAFYRDMLGLPENTAWIDVASPFDAAQLAVRVSAISTRFPDRQRSAQPIARLVAEQYAARPGNYLAFFSSFDYLDMVAAQFRAAHPHIPVWEQSRGMAEAERTAFLARFAPGGAGVGFAVLGGSFAEGIDLRGDRLVGAFIATLGLPQVNPVNEQLKDRMDATFGNGYDYAYLFPGLQKVVQAAGRVIRTREDTGVVVLIDDRFARPQVRALLPAWWELS